MINDDNARSRLWSPLVLSEFFFLPEALTRVPAFNSVSESRGFASFASCSLPVRFLFASYLNI